MEDDEINLDSGDHIQDQGENGEVVTSHAVSQHQNKNLHNPKLPPIKLPTDSKSDACISPDYPGKRRRVQHDYRRLSSSGYVDDYVTREKRFSSTSDSEVSMSPTPPKAKQYKTRSGESSLNGMQKCSVL